MIRKCYCIVPVTTFDRGPFFYTEYPSLKELEFVLKESDCLSVRVEERYVKESDVGSKVVFRDKELTMQ